MKKRSAPAAPPSARQKSAPDEKRLVLARDVYPKHLPILPLETRPLFPKMTAPLIIGDEKLRDMILATAKSAARFVGLVLRRPVETGDSSAPATGADLYAVGVIAEILQVAQPAADGPIQVVLGVHERLRIERVMQEQPHLIAAATVVLDGEVVRNDELKAYSLALVQGIKELVELDPLHKEELKLLMSHANLSEPARLADYAAALTTASGSELQEILEAFDLYDRLKKALYLIRKEIDLSKIQVRITKQIEEKISKHQRDFFLREQLKAIKKELGLEKEGKEAEVEKFERRLKELKPSEEALERITEEIEKLRLLEPASPEFHVSRTYVDWLTIVPWGVFTKDSYDLARAAKVLNADHYGLEDVKDRILEFLAVGIKKGTVTGSILCFVGPPGVGKTSLGQSIARSIGRNFYRFSLGGIRDEAEIKGHRRTYIGALPGKFIQAMKVCKSANPVIMLDEVDKIGASYQGDPASALLEVLDPEQNSSFLDHYLDVRFDLSNVFFICTANQPDTIPRPLLDRMEVIKLPGYIAEEKLHIAQKFLVPKQLAAHGVEKGQISFARDALREIIDGYAREPGVRGLENHIKKIIRKSVKRIVEGKVRSVAVTAGEIPEILGARLFTDEDPYKKPRAGVVTGLAWTSMGGEVLHVEATKVRTGRAGFKQTGQLGDVMIESSEIAYTYVRSLLDGDPPMRDFFAKNYIHLHVPAGATPKDGPSAGITMATALYSLALGKAVRPDIAMTGELSLVGLVMPVGGIKEKAVAAKRAKVKTLLLPEQNRKDFDEVPDHVKKGLAVHFVTSFADVVARCF
jgi:ATP-dependent Lon protease